VKNAAILLVTCTVLICAMVTGLRGTSTKIQQGETPAAPQKSEALQKVPWIGKIQVLNGCGVDGAANVVAEYLRSKKFDVKNIGNAPTGNYQTTLVVSRKKDQAMARQVADALSTSAVFLMRTQDEMYDVTVFVGADYKERVR
jgi:hypothetical protein